MSLAGKELGKDVVVWTEHQTRSNRWCKSSQMHLVSSRSRIPLNPFIAASCQAVIGVRSIELLQRLAIGMNSPSPGPPVSAGWLQHAFNSSATDPSLLQLINTNPLPSGSPIASHLLCWHTGHLDKAMRCLLNSGSTPDKRTNLIWLLGYFRQLKAGILLPYLDIFHSDGCLSEAETRSRHPKPRPKTPAGIGRQNSTQIFRHVQITYRSHFTLFETRTVLKREQADSAAAWAPTLISSIKRWKPGGEMAGMPASSSTRVYSSLCNLRPDLDAPLRLVIYTVSIQRAQGGPCWKGAQEGLWAVVLTEYRRRQDQIVGVKCPRFNAWHLSRGRRPDLPDGYIPGIISAHALSSSPQAIEIGNKGVWSTLLFLHASD
ncbi:hypothetical protein V8E53_007442 [Lactarius tabidus]